MAKQLNRYWHRGELSLKPAVKREDTIRNKCRQHTWFQGSGRARKPLKTSDKAPLIFREFENTLIPQLSA
jgi:hypothetical protein